MARYTRGLRAILRRRVRCSRGSRRSCRIHHRYTNGQSSFPGSALPSSYAARGKLVPWGAARCSAFPVQSTGLSTSATNLAPCCERSLSDGWRCYRMPEASIATTAKLTVVTLFSLRPAADEERCDSSPFASAQMHHCGSPSSDCSQRDSTSGSNSPGSAAAAGRSAPQALAWTSRSIVLRARDSLLALRCCELANCPSAWCSAWRSLPAESFC